MPWFDPRPHTIEEKKGSRIIARRASDGHMIARNSSFFKPFSEAEPQLKELASTDDGLTPDTEDMDPDAGADAGVGDAGPVMELCGMTIHRLSASLDMVVLPVWLFQHDHI